MLGIGRPLSLGLLGASMTEYQFLLDDGRGADLMTETVEAGDDAEAELLGRMRLSAAPSLQRIIIMRRAFEVAVLQRPQ